MIEKIIKVIKEMIGNLFSKPVHVEGCTCKDITRWSKTIDYDCPHHGHWRSSMQSDGF